MIKKALFVLGLLISVLSVSAQLYTTIDKDGYTNIREKPTSNSKIADKVLRYEIFFSADYFCEDEFDYSNLPPNWTAVKKSWGEPVGYIYTKNLRLIDSMPILYQSEKSWYADTVACANDTLSVLLILKPFDVDAHKIEYVTGQDYEYIQTIDGQNPKGLYRRFGDSEAEDREIEKFILRINNKEYSLPIDNISCYYNPRMAVFLGGEGDLYICVSAGDGGESYSITLSIVNGEIIHAKPSEAC